MTLMATLFILLVTVTPSFAASIMEQLFSGKTPGSNLSDPAERLAFVKKTHLIMRLAQLTDDEILPTDVRLKFTGRLLRELDPSFDFPDEDLSAGWQAVSKAAKLTVGPSIANDEKLDAIARQFDAQIEALKSTCIEASPYNTEVASRCFGKAVLRIVDAEDKAMEQALHEQQKRQLDLEREQKLQLQKERQLRAEREQALQMRDAQIDAARMQDAQLEAARIQAAGMILQGFALRGGPLGSFQPPASYVPYTPPAFVPFPVPRSLPPVSCSTRVVGAVAHTDCY